MFSLFRKQAAAPETLMPMVHGSRRMSLEERMAFRRDLAERVVRDGLQALAVPASRYRLRFMPLDPRHHRFVVMLDVAPDFRPRQQGRDCGEAEVETLIRDAAYERYGLTIEAVYWRAGQAGASLREPQAAARSLHPWELVSDEEKQALMEAIRAGGELPVLHVGELEYLTDLAPLEQQLGERTPKRF